MLIQRKYAEDLVTQACLSDKKVVHTPVKINVKYKNNDRDPLTVAHWLSNLFENHKTRYILVSSSRKSIGYESMTLSLFCPLQDHFLCSG